MRPNSLVKIFATGTALGVALCALVLMAATPARAADDDDEAIDQRFIRGVLEGLGLERDQKQIDYHERSPLVVPATRDLPPPEQGETNVSSNPAWPKDPDVARRNEERRLARERNKVSAADRYEADRLPLRPDQLAPGGDVRTPPSGRETVTTRDSEYGRPLTPSQLGYKGGIFSTLFGAKDKEESAQFTGEPQRSDLTEPPAGYRTPSPDQPYGGGKAAPPKPTDYLLTHGVTPH